LKPSEPMCRNPSLGKIPPTGSTCPADKGGIFYLPYASRFAACPLNEGLPQNEGLPPE